MAGQSDAKRSSSSFTGNFLKENHALYIAATNHTFIKSIRDGTIDVNNFKKWMEQDYHFVREFVRFVASVLVKMPRDAPEHDMDVILSGITVLQSEITWFRKEANFWQIFLEKVTLLQPNKEYCQFLRELETGDTSYALAVTAFWLIEVVYCASFMSCLEEEAKTPFELMNTVKRWGTPEFHDYTLSLKKLADKALQNASEAELEQAQKVIGSPHRYGARFDFVHNELQPRVEVHELRAKSKNEILNQVALTVIAETQKCSLREANSKMFISIDLHPKDSRKLQEADRAPGFKEDREIEEASLLPHDEARR